MSDSRLFFVIHQEDIRNAATVLHRHPELRLQKPQESDDENPWQRQAEALTETLQRIEAAMQFLGDRGEADRSRPSLSADAEKNETRLNEIEETIARLEAKRQALEEEIEKRQAEITDVRRLEGLEVGVAEIRATEFLFLLMGRMPNDQWKRLTVALSRMPALILPLVAEKDHRLVAAAADRRHAAVLQKVLESVRFRSLNLPDNVAGKAVDILPQLKGRLEEKMEALAILNREVERIAAKWSDWLAALHHETRKERELVERISRHRRTGPFYSIEGRLPVQSFRSSAFDLLQEVRDVLQHPYTIFMIPMKETRQL